MATRIANKLHIFQKNEIVNQIRERMLLIILYEKGLFDICDNADEPLKYFLSVERGRLDSEKVSDLI